jgi:acyl-CoA synthetase (NDP forming)
MTKNINKHPIDFIFHPQSIAVVGVSSSEPDGGNFMRALQNAGYHKKHKLYPINPKINKIGDLKCYPTILDCPNDIDYVISRIPAPFVPELLDQCIKKKVKTLHLFTAGFNETGNKEREELGIEIIKKAHKAGIRVIGPNCMGIYVPDEQISFTEEAPPEDSGNVFVASQSGVLAAEFIFRLASRGIRFSKVVSFGNAADLGVHDFLDYAANDEQTKYVITYIEGISNGKKFLSSLKKCALKKPTIVLKGGVTDSGARAASSHTGSLAGSAEIFTAICNQYGAITVESIEEAQDVLVTLQSSLSHINDSNIISISSGGGNSVLSSDIMDKYGMRLSAIDKLVKIQLRKFIPLAGTSIDNPIDFGVGMDQVDILRKLFVTLSKNKNVSSIFYSYGLMPWMKPNNSKASSLNSNKNNNIIKKLVTHKKKHTHSAEGLIIELSKIQKKIKVPIVIIHRSRISGSLDDINQIATLCLKHNVAFFDSITRASKIIKKITRWNKDRI